MTKKPFKPSFTPGKSSPAKITTELKKEAVKQISYVARNKAINSAASGHYARYSPSSIKIVGAKAHPTPLVESAAMATISAPVPTYEPQLPISIIRKAKLSESQLETVIYAGEAWSKDLPGRYEITENNLLRENPEGFNIRQGYFLGDGTGAGKGRQIAGCIMDQFSKGLRKAIWVSKNPDLVEASKRDWLDLGGASSDIVSLSDIKIHDKICFAEGILFLSYSTLRSSASDRTRLQQILDWAGEDFEGVMAFDESHEMGGVLEQKADGKHTKPGSLQGYCGVQMQIQMPRAKVIYASATGATSINNLAYAVRLGLWGPGTAFSSRNDFITSIDQSGITGMELVARELKAMGKYTARALSFDGVEYDILEHELTPEQIETYNLYADAWAIIHQNLDDILDITGVTCSHEGTTLNSGAKRSALSRFESTKQRFFEQLLISMKLPSVIPEIERVVAANESAVIQLVNTSEAMLKRRLAQTRNVLNEPIELSPHEHMVDYLNNAFPTVKMVSYIDENGNERSEPLTDEDGNTVHCHVAMRKRDELMEQICVLPKIATALDAIINHFGEGQVSEVTGRKQRLLTDPNGEQRLQYRSGRANISETEAFMDGRKKILIFSDAGGTGASYHASLQCKNQSKRNHFLLQPGWRSDRAVQGLGRTHRTEQAQPPKFIPCSTNTKGERRFISTISRRLDSLGALTKGQRETGGNNLFKPEDNLESVYAKRALIDWYHLLHSGKLKSISLGDYENITGLKLTEQDSGALKEDLPPIQRWLNRLLALRIEMQNSIFDEFSALIETQILNAKEQGTFDMGIETIRADNIEIIDTIELIEGDTPSTFLEIIFSKKVRPTSTERILEILSARRSAFGAYDPIKHRPALLMETNSLMDEEGNFIPRYKIVTPTSSYTASKNHIAKQEWTTLQEDDFIQSWADEVKALSGKVEEKTLYVATGNLLPIWDKLPPQNNRIFRIEDPSNSILGRLIDRTDVNSTLEKFALSKILTFTAEEIIEDLKRLCPVSIKFPVEITIKSSMVNNERRIEVSKFDRSDLVWLKSKGCFTEIISWNTRLFIPVGEAKPIIESIINAKR